MTGHVTHDDPNLRQCYVCHYTPPSSTVVEEVSPAVTTLPSQFHFISKDQAKTSTNVTNDNTTNNRETQMVHCAADKMLKRCQQCKSIYYCSMACQKSDWKRHRQMCRRYLSNDDDSYEAIGIGVGTKTNRKYRNRKSKKDAAVSEAYQELLNILQNKPLKQVQQEYAQISDLIKEREKDLTLSSTSTDDDISSYDDNKNRVKNQGSVPHVEAMGLDTARNDTIITSDRRCDIITNDETPAPIIKIQNDTISHPIRWIPLVLSSSSSVKSMHSTTSSSVMSWTFQLEYMPLLQCIQITLRPVVKADKTNVTVEKNLSVMPLNIDNVRVSFDMQYELPMLQRIDSKSNCDGSRSSKPDLSSTILTFKYIDTAKMESGYFDLSVLLHIALQRPKTWSGDDEYKAYSTASTSRPLSHEYTMLLVDNDTAITIRLKFNNNDGTHHPSDPYISRSLDLWDRYDDGNCKEMENYRVEARVTGQQLPKHRSTSLDTPQQQSKNYCLGCRYCHTPFIPLLLPSTATTEHTNFNDGVEPPFDSNENDDMYDGLSIRHILPLPTGHLNDLNDYLICYNDGPSNVNFDTNNSNNRRYDIPPSGVMYENDIIYTVSETNVTLRNLCSLSIPGYGEMLRNENKKDTGFVPTEIIDQSQTWQCSTLPTVTDLDDSLGVPETVTCSVCASVIGYKIISDLSTNTKCDLNSTSTKVGFHLLKHQMTLLEKEADTLTPSVQTTQHATASKLQKAILKMSTQTLTQFVVYEMIRIAETKGIFTFAICKSFIDNQDERYAVGGKKKGLSKQTIVLTLRLLNWNTIAATTAKSTFPHVTCIDQNKQVISETNAPVWVPVWQRRAKVYYETIELKNDGMVHSNTADPQESKGLYIASSSRKQFMAQHSAWCCNDETTVDSKKSADLFMNGVAMNETSATCNENGRVADAFDPSMIRLFLSTTDFEKLLAELQESSTFYSQDVTVAIRSSLSTTKGVSANPDSVFCFASISLE